MPFGTATKQKIADVAGACERNGKDSIILLSGVAGTGKTLIALAAAQRFAGNSLLVQQIQFHQSYTYEDFVEGLRPTKSGGFETVPGLFTSWNEQALHDPANRYVLLIEEFTRANITAVIGELMTFVEYRDRSFETPVGRRKIQVAPNLVVVGTMNPRDRSALELDEALIRRLRIIDFPPDTEQLAEMLTAHGTAPELVSKLQALFRGIETKHSKTYNTYMPFGHGIFKGVKTEDDLKRLWDERIKHLLYRPSAPAHLYARDIEELYPVDVKAKPPTAAAT